ncbi:MAG TPA: nucleoside-diphosphate sugar epimerase/dehydratase [Coxiellaceae bacterium]|nr:nucleoside-diphosphate sugar epimerase/dehydratase [Coxiellaceae bacterium]
MKGLISFNRSKIILHDLFMASVAWLGAYWLHYDLAQVSLAQFTQAFKWLPIMLAVQMSVATLFGVYRGIWRYSSLADLERLVKSIFLASLIMAVIISFTGRSPHIIPKSIVPMYAALLILLWGGPRFLYRRLRAKHFFNETRRVLIIGAGRAGEGLVRDLLHHPDSALKPVAYLDDSAKKIGQEIHGVRVVGLTQELENFSKELNIDLVIIAIPSISAENMRRIVDDCDRCNLAYRTLPSINDLAEGRVNIDALRKVSIEDLLGRAAVDLDWNNISQSLTGKRVLVTGGGGSIGSELCRQIANLGPRQLIIFEHSEFNLYQIGCELIENFPELNLVKELVDIADYHTVARLMALYKPDVVFHAAAYKHVPMLEDKVFAAARNNVLGTRIMAELAVRHQAKVFVLVSTDKAVNPTNTMGLSKRLAEIYCQNLSYQTQTHFITVRFGNVMGSAGSVLPLFTRQLERGGPLTVTHPEVTRFFMTIKEAASLILQASTMGKGGEIYVLDMGKPVKIRYLAEQMIKLSGKRVDEDVKIKYIGLRAGEKMYEELFHENESLTETTHEKIYLAQSRILNWTEVVEVFSAIQQAYELNKEKELMSLMVQLVPEVNLNNKKNGSDICILQ